MNRLTSFRCLAALLCIAAGAAQADTVALLPEQPAWEAHATAPQEAPEKAATAGTKQLGGPAVAEANSGLLAASGLFVSSLPDIGLWKYVSTIRALQQSQPLQVLESQLRIVEVTSTVPAAVPLPGAAWFMVMGLLGLAGVRATNRRSAAGDSPAASPVGAVPA